MPCRRTFIAATAKLALGSFAIAACSGAADTEEPAVITLGPLERFPSGKTMLDVVRLVVIRDRGGLGVMSLGCTHQLCLLQSAGEGYRCPCHGSMFGPLGQRTSGPAPRSLPWYEVAVSPEGSVLVRRDREVSPEWRLPLKG